MTLTQEQSLDLLPFIESLYVRDKEGRQVPFEPNWAQRQILEVIKRDYQEGKPSRIIVLKARQLGVSTLAEGIMYALATVFDNINCLVAAHRNDATEYLFGITKFFHESWDFKDFNPARYSTKRQLDLDRRGSSVKVQTGGGQGFGRTMTLFAAHVSEAAFWSNPAEDMNALAQALPEVPGSVLIVESTANGVGNWFEEEYNKAKVGANDFTGLFFPWFLHYEYIPCRGKGCQDGSCEKCLQAAAGIKPKDADERFLLRQGATLAHVAWRRWAIANRCFGSVDLFKQEMPATDSEAFLTSGVHAFPESDLQRCYVKPGKWQVGRLEETATGEVEFIPDPMGPLRLYARPGKAEGYFIGADPCYGSVDGDFAAAQVINRRTYEQVATWHGRTNPWVFADELILLGRYFNMAMIAPETEGGGLGTISRLLESYPYIWQHRMPDHQKGMDRSSVLYGWQTNYRRKQWAITKLADIVERGGIILHDKGTYDEMKAYVYYGGAGWTEKWGPAAKDGHDDLVMALAIAVICESTESPLDDYALDRKRSGPTFARKESTYEAWE